MFRKYFKIFVGRYMKRTVFTGYVYDFTVGFDDIEVNNIKDIHKYFDGGKQYSNEYIKRNRKIFIMQKVININIK